MPGSNWREQLEDMQAQAAASGTHCLCLQEDSSRKSQASLQAQQKRHNHQLPLQSQMPHAAGSHVQPADATKAMIIK